LKFSWLHRLQLKKVYQIPCPLHVTSCGYMTSKIVPSAKKVDFACECQGSAISTALAMVGNWIAPKLCAWGGGPK
jgi:hypothetical protein